MNAKEPKDFEQLVRDTHPDFEKVAMTMEAGE